MNKQGYVIKMALLVSTICSMILPIVNAIPYDNYFHLEDEGIPAGHCIWTNDNENIWAAQVRIVVDVAEFSSGSYEDKVRIIITDGGTPVWNSYMSSSSDTGWMTIDDEIVVHAQNWLPEEPGYPSLEVDIDVYMVDEYLK